MSLFNYVMRKVWLHQTRIGLSLYDDAGHGFLCESGYISPKGSHVSNEKNTRWSAPKVELVD
ncbi:Serine/threonine-protein phosphatase 2A regulatory subunit B'' subunit gamma [Homalodisca vitripennis]|nr:Serine/threonine-protein phosphatase 2A regulatory subunit B'' subunit gamma [Homalodisca vitripennis]